MNTKKMLAGVCAGAMALSMTVPAFAAGPIANTTSVNFNGKPAEGEIAVVMQTGKHNLYVNPYGLPYTLGFGEVFVSGGSTFDKTQDIAIKEPDTASEGFFSDTAVIQNNGNIALNVNVTMTTTEKGKAKVVLAANKPTVGNVTAQYMYGNLEIAPATIGTGTATVTKTAETSAGAGDAVMEEQTGVKVVTPTWASKKTVAIPAGGGTAGTAGTPSNVVDTDIDLPAVSTVEDETTGASVTVPGVVAYRLAGSTIPMDKESSGGADDVDPWDEGDVADVTVAFTFTPVAATPSNP